MGTVEPSLDGGDDGSVLGRVEHRVIKTVVQIAAELREKMVTVNGLSLGVTEDLILKHYPKSGSIKKSLDELKEAHAEVRLVENMDVAACLSYLACAYSASLTGQVIQLNHGLNL